jgi:prepilin-type N-terminal cleavage/methylation domain-containing protein
MARRVAGFSLLELTLTVALIGILALPMSGLVVEHVRGSTQTDLLLAAESLARYELERVALLRYGNVNDWCSAPASQMPPSENECPGSVSAPNPYAGMAYLVSRQVQSQTPTDGSDGMVRVRVRVFRRSETSSPLIQLFTYRANQVSYGVP